MEKEPKPKKIYDKKAAKPRIEYYCAYQERSQQEVRDKLYNMGLHQKEVEELISELIEGNFLNEERFAISYAGGKFRMKQWGKYKIKQALKVKRVSDYCIKKALQSIPFDEYLAAIDLVILKKSKTIKEKDAYRRQYKLLQYAVSRGFETELVQERIKAML